MPYTYVGDIPRNLESGRPIVFGDVVDTLEPEDARLSPWLVETGSVPVEPTPPTDEVT